MTVIIIVIIIAIITIMMKMVMMIECLISLFTVRAKVKSGSGWVTVMVTHTSVVFIVTRGLRTTSSCYISVLLLLLP